MKTTIKDVAKEAGVSVALISKFLNGASDARMQPATRERIELAIEKLHYRPSTVARSLRSDDNRNLGLVIGNLRRRYFATFADAVLSETEKRGYRLLITLSGNGQEKELQNLYFLLNNRVDGVIYHEYLLSDEEMLKLKRRQYSLVLVERESSIFPSAGTDCREGVDGLARWCRQNGVQELCCVFPDYCSMQPILEETFRRDELRQTSFCNVPPEELLKKRPDTVFFYAWEQVCQFLRVLDRETTGYSPGIFCAGSLFDHRLSDPRIIGGIFSDMQAHAEYAVELLIAGINHVECPLKRPVSSFKTGEEFEVFRQQNKNNSWN